MIIDSMESVVKELDRYGEIIHNHEWTNGQDVLRNKTYLYDNKLYDVTRENGNIIIICLGGKIYD